MKAVCINNGGLAAAASLVEGTTYNVRDREGTEDYWVEGVKGSWLKNRFKLIECDTCPGLERPGMILPTDPQERKNMPITTGVIDYFPLAMAEVAKLSKAGNDQHNPGQPLHWDKSKSTDHADTIARHLIDRGKFDSDGQRHSAKLAWRALALLQTELEAEKK